MKRGDTHPLSPAELQGPQAIRALRREWMGERVGWLLIFLILSAGLLGAFGDGILAHRSQRAGPLELRYESIVRANAPARLEVRVARPGNADTLRVWLHQDYMAAVQLQHIVPAPARSYSDSGRLVMDFTTVPGTGPYVITVEIEPDRIGGHMAVLGSGTDSLQFHQFVFP